MIRCNGGPSALAQTGGIRPAPTVPSTRCSTILSFISLTRMPMPMPDGQARNCRLRRNGNMRREVVLTVLLMRSEEHTSELQSLMRISYAVFCLKKKKTILNRTTEHKHTCTNTY